MFDKCFENIFVNLVIITLCVQFKKHEGVGQESNKIPYDKAVLSHL
jgi:hypothetical protein